MANLYVRVRPDAQLSRHRQYASRYKWGAQAVVAQKGDIRTTVIWNNSPDAITVNVLARGGSAILIDKLGNEVSLLSAGDRYPIRVPAATVRFEINEFVRDPINYFYIGGDPMILVETGVADTEVDIQGFVLKPADHENGAMADGTGAGDIDDRSNPSAIGQNPARIGRLS